MFFKISIYIYILYFSQSSLAKVSNLDTILNGYYKIEKIEKKIFQLSAIDIKIIKKNTGQKIIKNSFILIKILEKKKIKALGIVQTLKIRSKNTSLLYLFKKKDINYILQTIEVLAFHEPKEYLPRKEWIKQFFNKKLQKLTSFIKKRKITLITGATLSSYTFFRASIIAAAIINLKFKKL